MERITFSDPEAASAIIARLQAKQPGFEKIKPALISILSEAADPDRSLVHFERFVENYGPEIIPLFIQTYVVSRYCVLYFPPVTFLTEIRFEIPQSFNLLFGPKNYLKERPSNRFLKKRKIVLRSGSGGRKKRTLFAAINRKNCCVSSKRLLDLYEPSCFVSQLHRTAIALTK
jgi:hypothetical protein